MLLFIIRHGDPTYDPDCLTKRGKLQAEAVAKRLSLYGIDEIYSSPLIRAQQTAEPTSVLMNKDINIEPWMSESIAWEQFAVTSDNAKTWIFSSSYYRTKIYSPEVVALGHNWYDAKIFEGTRCKEGCKLLLKNSDEFLMKLGYIHDNENCNYVQKSKNDKHIAAFCHQGFGLSWIATLIDLPLPVMWTYFDISHSNMTVIEFEPEKDSNICIPKILTMSNDSHLYREGLPTKYNNRIYF